jgi:sulfur-oxidizing protein SoxY
MQAKDPDTEMVGLGKMIVKTFPPALDANPIWSAQVMIKHPNANGMQLDINTANIIPPRYVNTVTVKRDGELVFKMDSTFSVSTNPNFRFTFARGHKNELDVVVTDTDAARFAAQSQASGS